MPFRIIVLGTGTIIPSAYRRATSLLVEADAEALLLDCGPGALEALEENGFSYRSLRTILLTHCHPDHTLDLGRLLAAVNADREAPVERALRVFGPPGLGELVDRWNALYPSTISKRRALELHEISSGVVPCGFAAAVSACPARHGDRSAFAYRLECAGRSLVYTGDTEYSEELSVFSRGADLLVAECSFPDSSPVEGHMTPSAVARLASAAGARRVILVHLYPAFEGEDPAAAARKRFGGNIETAWDGMEIDLES